MKHICCTKAFLFLFSSSYERWERIGLAGEGRGTKKGFTKQTKWEFLFRFLCMWKWAESDYLNLAPFDPYPVMALNGRPNAVGNEMVNFPDETTYHAHMTLVIDY
jgi:hypothetical protein